MNSLVAAVSLHILETIKSRFKVSVRFTGVLRTTYTIPQHFRKTIAGVWIASQSC